MCTQSRPRFILSSKRVFWGVEFEPMLTPRDKSPLPENVPRRGSNPQRCGQRAQTLPTSYSGPWHGDKALASSATDLGSISTFTVNLLCRSSHTGDLEIVTPVATPPGVIESALELCDWVK